MSAQGLRASVTAASFQHPRPIAAQPRVSLPPSSLQSSPSKAAPSIASGTTYHQGSTTYHHAGDERAEQPVQLTGGALLAFDTLQQQQQQRDAQLQDAKGSEEGYGSESSSDFSYRYGLALALALALAQKSLYLSAYFWMLLYPAPCIVLRHLICIASNHLQLTGRGN
jgi:hypothetical protein